MNNFWKAWTQIDMLENSKTTFKMDLEPTSGKLRGIIDLLYTGQMVEAEFKQPGEEDFLIHTILDGWLMPVDKL